MSNKETLNAETFFSMTNGRYKDVKLSKNSSIHSYPFSVKDVIEFAEAYHKAKVEAITDEEIDEYSKNTYDGTFEQLIYSDGKEDGAKWFKNRLINENNHKF